MALNVIARIALSKDILDIQRLYKQGDNHHAALLPEVFQFVDGDARDTDVIQKWIDRDDADYLVAELDGKVVGFVNVQRNSRPQYPLFRPHEFAFIENAVVDEPHRSKGVGTLLFRAAIDWAMSRGLQHVETTVWNANADALRFYLDQGFHPMSTRIELDTTSVSKASAK